MSGLDSPFAHTDASDPVTKRYVVGFLFWFDQVLLIRKARPAWQRGKLNGIGGHVEPGETYAQAMEREFVEETQINKPIQWEHFVTLRGNRSQHPAGPFEIAFYRAATFDRPPEDGSGDAATERTELHPALALSRDVLPNLRWLVPLAYYEHRADWPFLLIEQQGAVE